MCLVPFRGAGTVVSQTECLERRVSTSEDQKDYNKREGQGGISLFRFYKNDFKRSQLKPLWSPILGSTIPYILLSIGE